MKTAALICEHLNCGSAASVQPTDVSVQSMWRINSGCFQSGSDLSNCVVQLRSPHTLKLTCSESVRLLNGSSRCSGRLQVKTNPSDQTWSSVCEADLDLQDAQVVCRELGCGAPSVLQGALYGDVQTPRWSPEFQCGGHESALLDCRSSGSARSSCSPGKAAGLTCSGRRGAAASTALLFTLTPSSLSSLCSEFPETRLVGENTRCAGSLQIRRSRVWRPALIFPWTLEKAAVFCSHLHCGSAVSADTTHSVNSTLTVIISDNCFQSGSHFMKCSHFKEHNAGITLTCSDSVRLLNGSSRCSGRLQVKTNPSDQTWSSVCEADLDLQDAQVVCRELGCGAPSVLQGALYGDVQTPRWSPEFQCGGHESALLDCRSSGSARSSCSPGKAAGLTCSGFPEIRLVGENSRCAGSLQIRRSGVWRPTFIQWWSLEKAAVFCSHLHCGSAVSADETRSVNSTLTVGITDDCFQSGSDLMKCSVFSEFPLSINLSCSDLLLHPVLSVSSSSSILGVSEAQQQGLQVVWGSTFTISCSIQPQYPGGSFQLTFTSSNTSYKSTQPAVNHSAHFLFPAAEPAHRGNYSCVYHLHVFGHDFWSESRLLSLSVSDPTAVVVRWVVVPLSLLLLQGALWLYYKASRGQTGRPGGL
uniref:SRCR domain-containing protein n=1 Tax=Salarias fasciatus TaxID=181472 RepID=A0A672JM39_SALFA